VSISSYRISIEVKGGSGGNGIVSFNRSRRQPRGGPDGGDGGEGGSVYIEASENVYSLAHIRSSPLKAENGGDGGKNKKHGRNGNDLMVYVPVGTTIYIRDEEKPIADLTETNQKIKVALGGKGGKGNINFATPSNQVPRIATWGKEGESKTLELVFNPKAEIVVLGPPNSGKSSLVAHIIGKKIDISNYPFTTKKPHLWTYIHKFSRYTFMDTPPLTFETIEEIKILTERAKILLVVIDNSDSESLEKLKTLIRDIEEHFNKDRSKKIGVVLTKIDKVDMPHEISIPYPVFPASVVTGEGIDKLKEFLFSLK
jgi:GTP-binding protein